MYVCCTEDKKGGVDRSSTVIAKEPEGKANNSRESEKRLRFDVSPFIYYICNRVYIYVCVCVYTYTRTYIFTHMACVTCERSAIALVSPIRVSSRVTLRKTEQDIRIQHARRNQKERQDARELCAGNLCKRPRKCQTREDLPGALLNMSLVAVKMLAF